MSDKPRSLLSTSAVLREVQDLTSLTWDSTLSADSTVNRDVTPTSRDFTPTPRDETSTSRDVTPFSVDVTGLSRDVTPDDMSRGKAPLLRRSFYLEKDLVRVGKPSHSSTPAGSDPPKRKMLRKTTCKYEISPSKLRKSSSKYKKLFFASEVDNSLGNVDKIKICKRDRTTPDRPKKTLSTFRSLNEPSPTKLRPSSNSRKHSRLFFASQREEDPCKSDRNEKCERGCANTERPRNTGTPLIIKPERRDMSPSCFKKDSSRKSSVSNSVSSNVRKSRYFFIEEEDEMWDPTPSLSFSRFIKSSKSPSKSNMSSSRSETSLLSTATSPRSPVSSLFSPITSSRRSVSALSSSPMKLRKSSLALSCDKVTQNGYSNNLKSSSKPKSLPSSGRLFFCDPSDIITVPLVKKSENTLKTETTDPDFTSILFSPDLSMKCEVKKEECEHVPVKTEKLERIPGPLIGLDPQFWLPIKVRIQTLHSVMRVSPLVPGLWVISNHPVHRVQIIGLVTGVDVREKYRKYKVEDTTGAVSCIHWNSDTTRDYFENTSRDSLYSLGDLVCVTAKITQFRGNIELKVVEMFSLDDMNQLTLHLALSDEALVMLEKPFVLPDVTSQCVEFEKKIRDAVMENVLQNGPCSKLDQYKEIQNVRIWLECLTALTGREEEELLREIHKEFSQVNEGSKELLKERKHAQNLISECLKSSKQVDTNKLKMKYPSYAHHVDAVISQLIMSGDIYQTGDFTYTAL